MVCHARPAIWFAAILIIVSMVLYRPVGHFFGTAAILTAVAMAVAGAAVAAALAVAAFMAVRRRRAAAGGCVSCRFRCQHAMTEQTARLWLVSVADRGPGRAGGPAGADDLAAPRWPDRPFYRAGQPSGRAGQPAAPVPRRQRAGSRA